MLALALILTLSILGCVPREEYNQLRTELAQAQLKLNETEQKLSEMLRQVAGKESELKSMDDLYRQEDERYQKLNMLLDSVDYYSNSTHGKYDELLADLGELALDEKIVADELSQEHLRKPPYIRFGSGKISYVWKDLSGTLTGWTLPVDAYFGWLKFPHPEKMIVLTNNQGDVGMMMDFQPFVLTGGFNQVIPSLFKRYPDELTFAKEILNLESQLTRWSDEIGEVPRWPIETLSEGGGDCEDLSILYAAMLRASPYPYELNLVYLDARRPTAPLENNHVIVHIKTDKWSAFVDPSAGNAGWDLWKNVRGWMLEV